MSTILVYGIIIMWTVLIICWIVVVFIPRIFVLVTFCYISNSSVFSIGIFNWFSGLVDIVFVSFWFSTALAAVLTKLIYFFLGVCIFNLFEIFTYPIIFWIVRNISFLTYILIIIVIMYVVGCLDCFILFLCPTLLTGLSLLWKNSVIFFSFDFSLCILNSRFVFFIHCFRLLTGIFLYSFSEWLNHFCFETGRLSIVFHKIIGWLGGEIIFFSRENLSSSIFWGG